MGLHDAPGTSARPPGAVQPGAAVSEENERMIERRVAVCATVAAVAILAVPAPVAAHGAVPADPPSLANLLLGWSFEPLVSLSLLAAAGAWLALVRRVDRAHPRNPVPRRRTAAFLAGLAAIAVALLSGVERYDTSLFSVHMVQHVLLTFAAAPLLVLSAPITLLLRASSAATRRRWILPALHSRVVRAVSFPVVAWVLFAAVMWATHFSPLFDLALEDRLVHDLEHGLYLGSALLFWWPALGTDPTPWRMTPPVRAFYVFLQMPQNTFLAVALLGAPAALYPHYAGLVRPWGPDPLLDQQIAAGIMWLVGDLAFLAAVIGLVWLWMREDLRDGARADRRADAAMAEIREREARLAERLSREEGR
jgi:putative copper resistance protein D